jgi:hypothetical protein
MIIIIITIIVIIIITKSHFIIIITSHTISIPHLTVPTLSERTWRASAAGRPKCRSGPWRPWLQK